MAFSSYIKGNYLAVISIISFLEAGLKISNNNSNNQNLINDVLYIFIKNNQRSETSPVDDDYVEIIITTRFLGRHYPRLGQC